MGTIWRQRAIHRTHARVLRVLLGSAGRRLSRPFDATLWHYTSGESALGITTSTEVWATQFTALNDMSEVVHLQCIVALLHDSGPDSV